MGGAAPEPIPSSKEAHRYRFGRGDYSVQARGEQSTISRGAAGEDLTATKRRFQAMTWNRNATELFACKWLRARDLNRRCRTILALRTGD